MQGIPRYGLFGEVNSEDFGPLIHCETIAARSRLYHWEISPHRHPALSQVLFLASGEVEVLLDDTKNVVKSAAAITVPAASPPRRSWSTRGPITEFA